MTPRPPPVCHRTLHPGYVQHTADGGRENVGANENSWPCEGSRCSLAIRIHSATDPQTTLMRCADNPHAEPWIDPNVPQPMPKEVTE